MGLCSALYVRQKYTNPFFFLTFDDGGSFRTLWAVYSIFFRASTIAEWSTFSSHLLAISMCFCIWFGKLWIHQLLLSTCSKKSTTEVQYVKQVYLYLKYPCLRAKWKRVTYVCVIKIPECFFLFWVFLSFWGSSNTLSLSVKGNWFFDSECGFQLPGEHLLYGLVLIVSRSVRPDSLIIWFRS